MIITFTSSFLVSGMDDAIAQATSIWQRFTGDTDEITELPWSATIDVRHNGDGLEATLTAEVTPGGSGGGGQA
jgi:hypothetical protein